MLLAGIDPQHTEQRLLVHTKNSDGPLGPALGYAVGEGLIRWLGERTWSGEEVLAGRAHAGAGADAQDFWQAALREGPRRSKDVLEEGTKQFGLAAITLNRARTALRIESKMVARLVSLPLSFCLRPPFYRLAHSGAALPGARPAQGDARLLRAGPAPATPR